MAGGQSRFMNTSKGGEVTLITQMTGDDLQIGHNIREYTKKFRI